MNRGEREFAMVGWFVIVREIEGEEPVIVGGAPTVEGARAAIPELRTSKKWGQAGARFYVRESMSMPRRRKER
jgi:hypothetical protein